MVTVICQYTGIEFEATSKRQKNHPKVSALLNTAAKAGGTAYGTAKERLEEAREAGMTDIDAIIAYVRSGAMAAQADADTAVQRHEEEKRQAIKDAKYRRAAREEENSILRDGGYRWHKEDEESMDAFGANAFEMIYGNADHVWILTDREGREVSVRQAMAEMTGRGNYRAQRWLNEHSQGNDK